VNKDIDNSNVSVSKLCTWDVWNERTLVLLLEWCEMYVENNVPRSRQVEFDDDSSDTDSDWHLKSCLQIWQHLLYIIITLVTILRY